MRIPVLLSLAAFLCVGTGCKKEVAPQNLSTPEPFTEYIIPKGEHYVQNNFYKPVEVRVLKFSVRFDSSAVYTTANPENQYDINKLYGFADNGAHHQQYSARIGWRWSDGALRLFGYTYNDGLREEKEITVISIGAVHRCTIEVRDTAYVFYVDNALCAMPRRSSMSTAKGYQLYPYFGGDEVAPHEVRIWIRDETSEEIR